MPQGERREAAIRLRDVAFAWPGRTAFRLAVSDLAIERGERVFLFGPSGSGKSTLLALVCGIATPDRGSVEIDGVDLAALSGPRRDRFRAERIGVIFQMFNLLPYAPPLANILLPLTFAPERRRRLADPRAEALRLTSALGLPGDLVRRAASAELSMGQQQRVAAARALIGGPSLVVADEPTSSLDAAAQGTFVDLLMAQADAARSTLLMVSHDERLAARFDRVIDLDAVADTSRRRAA
jgi:putative ABC transport system ATP-binding protein